MVFQMLDLKYSAYCVCCSAP